jgi:hypothetical protein
VLLHQDFLRSTRLKRPRRNRIAKTILANHADGDMDFAIRAVPAAETDIIAKTVIHPNIFRLTSTYFEVRYELLPMRFSPGDFHFMVGIRKLAEGQARLTKMAPGFASGVSCGDSRR